MNLTERQVNILTFLVNIKDWVTSEQLAIHLNLNKKLVQNEIRVIASLFRDEIEIEINKNKGYCIRYISEESREALYIAANGFGGKNSLLVKRSTIVLYLLFLKEYITMQDLANLFYMSKSSVSLEMDAIKRWMKRYEGIELEVNKKHGILIHGSERVKRIYCTNHGTVQAFEEAPFMDEIKRDYKTYLHLMRETLAVLCVECDMILTGEEFRKNTRFLAETVLRSRMGYIRVQDVQPEEWLPVVQQISENVRKRLGYNFTEAEMYDIQMLLLESNTLTRNTHQDMMAIKNKIVLFGEQIKTLLKLDGIEIFRDTGSLENYVGKMQQRESNGNVAINHYNEEIVLRYPLEVSLCYHLVPQFFSKKVTKETSNIALYLASEFQHYRNGTSVLLISNQCDSVVWQLQNLIKQYAVFDILVFDVMPVYQFQLQSETLSYYDMLLTTEQEILLQYSGFFLISPIISSGDIGFLYRYLNKRFDGMMWERKGQAKEQYVKKIHLRKTVIPKWAVETIIGQSQDHQMSYHTFAQDKIYICRIASDVESSVFVYDLDEPVIVLQKKIKKIIYVSFCPGNMDVFLFFEMVSDVLNEIV